MKNLMFAVGVSTATAAIVFACKNNSDKENDNTAKATAAPTAAPTAVETTTPESSSLAPDFLLDATREAAPVFQPGSLALGLNLSETSELGSVYYSIFNMLRSWNPDTDNGKVDMGNIYHVLDVAGDQYGKVSGYTREECKTATCTQCKPAFDAAFTAQCITKDGPVSSSTCDPLVAAFSSSCPGETCEPCYEGWVMASGSGGESCTPFTAPKTVASPIDFGMTDTYACGVNSGQMGEQYPFGVAAGTEGSNNEVKKLLAGFVWAGSGSQGEFNVIQGNYNETSKDLKLQFAQLVDHDQSQFVRRIEILGNVSEHSFTLRSLVGPKQGAQGSWVSIVGKGISQGSGNFFLLKIKSSENGWSTARYLCLPAAADGDTLLALSAQKPAGDESVATDCADYQQDVDALTFFEFPADVPQSVTDFQGKGGSSVLLDF